MSTRNITKKRPRREDSIESSSSEETELLKQPKDVLALGEHLVRELGLKDSVDTLGRWMSHHLAELINEAKDGRTAAKRTEASRQATETILKIWEHRRSLPGRSYPLTPLNEVLTVLHRLRPEANPFGVYRQYGDTDTDHYAAILFDDLTRLVIALLLMRVPSDAHPNNTDNRAVEALSDEEQQVLGAILGWYEFFTPKTTKSTLGQKRKKRDAKDAVDLKQVAIQLIDQMEPTLAELRNELQKTS
jgi:hypothetical protein